MIIVEKIEDHEGLVRRYSDKGFLIHKIGTDEYYGEAVDLETAPWEYEESDILVEQESNGDDIPAEQALAEIVEEIDR